MRSLKKAEVKVTLTFPNRKQAETIFAALKPEVQASAGFKSTVKMSLEGKTLTMVFSAPTLSSLRASVNSFCRWISQLQRILELA